MPALQGRDSGNTDKGIILLTSSMQSARSISNYRPQESVVHAAPDNDCVTMQWLKR